MQYSLSELEAYLDEALPTSAMADVEAALRTDPALARQLGDILRRRDQGVHSLGDIWRRERLSCPSREQLGSMLLDALEPQVTQYIEFHIQQAGCRICRANLEDLKAQVQAAGESHETAERQQRRRQYFQSSVGYLRGGTRPGPAE